VATLQFRRGQLLADKLESTDSAVDLDPTQFERQLEHLASRHRVLTLDDAVAELRASQPTGWSGASAAPEHGPGVVVTFDDGTADFADVVTPALVRHGVPATLFVATEFVERARPFPWGAPPASWRALNDAASTGLVALESHTHGHGLLDRLDPDQTLDLLERLQDVQGLSLLVVTDDPRIHARMDRHLHLSGEPPRHSEAA